MRNLAGLVVLLVTLLTSAVVATQVPSGPGRFAEPRLAAAYLAAYALGDEGAAELVASPLYAAEWARRGVAVAQRQALLPHPQTPDHQPTPWLRLQYVGGAADGGGFGHLLYLASATEDHGCPSPTVWRVDTEPGGQVIWSELVWSFSCPTTAVTTVPPKTWLPDGWGGPRPELVVGIRATAERGGYYVVRLRASPGHTVPGAVIFYGVDADGATRPGAWSYGRREPGPSTYGASRESPSVGLDAAQLKLREAYLTALCGGC